MSVNAILVGQTPKKFQVTNALEFVSDGEFTLATNGNVKTWDGTIYYTNGQNDWAVWSGTTTLSSKDGYLALKGKGNSYVSNGTKWVITPSSTNKVACKGSIENLRDYLGTTNMVVSCYKNMFNGCSALSEAPELPATKLANYCYYQMFRNCTALKTAPELPATKLVNYCYSEMFYGCTALETAPELPAIELAIGCYSEMFYGCTALETAPELPAIELVSYCYYQMFASCTSLVEPPELPATKIGAGSCQEMFNGCTNLTRLPVLNVLAFYDYSCSAMFEGCTKIKLSTTQDSTYKYPYRLPLYGTGSTSSSNVFANMFKLTGGSFTGSPSINTTYYADNPPVYPHNEAGFVLITQDGYDALLENDELDNNAVYDILDDNNISGIINTSTQTIFNGVLAGNGSTVTAKAVDSTPTANSDNLITSGAVAAIASNTKNYRFAPTSSGGTYTVTFPTGAMFLVLVSNLNTAAPVSALYFGVAWDSTGSHIATVVETNPSAQSVSISSRTLSVTVGAWMDVCVLQLV